MEILLNRKVEKSHCSAHDDQIQCTDGTVKPVAVAPSAEIQRDVTVAYMETCALEMEIGTWSVDYIKVE